MVQGKNVLRLVADSLLLINEASMSVFVGKADMFTPTYNTPFNASGSAEPLLWQ
jgi:hypothetical protein